MIDDKQIEENQKLPKAYIFYLTLRSMFLDHLINTELIKEEDWTNFEQTRLFEYLEKEKKESEVNNG